MLEFPKEDIIKLKECCQRILGRPLMPEEQIFITKDDRIWCDDWEAIEILKYLFNGKNMYYQDPIPNRLKNNLLFPGKEAMEAKALKLVEEFKTGQGIVDYFFKKRGR